MTRLRRTGLVGALALTAATACSGASSPTRPTPTTISSTSAPARTLGFSDDDNGRSATVAVGQRMTVILHSSDFVFVAPSDTTVLGGGDPPTVTPGGPTCVESAGSGCGTVVVSFVGLTPGATLVRAERTACLPPACLPTNATWELHIEVTPAGAPTTTAATTETIPTTTILTISPTTGPAPSLPATEGEVRGTVLFSPVCPVERIPPDPACAPVRDGPTS